MIQQFQKNAHFVESTLISLDKCLRSWFKDTHFSGRRSPLLNIPFPPCEAPVLYPPFRGFGLSAASIRSRSQDSASHRLELLHLAVLGSFSDLNGQVESACDEMNLPLHLPHPMQFFDVGDVFERVHHLCPARTRNA